MTLIPNANTIMLIGLCFSLISLLQWNLLRKCKCGEKQSFLRPQWKKHGKKKWTDDDL